MITIYYRSRILLVVTHGRCPSRPTSDLTNATT